MVCDLLPSYKAATFGQAYGPFAESEAAKVCERALELGITHFDTAPLYGESQRILGNALREIAPRWPREKYTISTKVGRYGKYDSDYSIPRIREGLENSLKLLGTDYIDIIVGHDVEFEDEDKVLKALPVLFDYKDKGIVRKVAISGYPLEKLLRIAQRCKTEVNRPLDVMFSYCQLNLHSKRLLDYAPKFREAGVETIVNLYVLLFESTTRLALSRPCPPEWHYASPELQAGCSAVRSLCSKLGVSTPGLATKYALQRGLERDGDGRPWIQSTVIGLSTISEVEQAAKLLGDGKLYTAKEEDALVEVTELMKPFQNFEWVEVHQKPE
ncbi:hypothetical protein HDU93_009008 [Gonapodya sp. JEL0774]|nr:hypothetical protein HDU93_009008 [Gonapodya sp. JEL0774]